MPVPGGIRPGDAGSAGPGPSGLEGSQSGGNGLLVRIAEKSYPEAACGRRQVLREVAFSGSPGEIIALLAPRAPAKQPSCDRARPRPGLRGRSPAAAWLDWGDVRGATTAAGAHRRGRSAPCRSATRGSARSWWRGWASVGTEALYPKALSLGMARRVALARALLGRPAMLVLDEPCASLDPETAADGARLLGQAARRDGTLILLSTHDLDQVLGFADRLLLLAGKPARLATDRRSARRCRPPLHRRWMLKQSLLVRLPFLNARSEQGGVARRGGAVGLNQHRQVACPVHEFALRWPGTPIWETCYRESVRRRAACRDR